MNPTHALYRSLVTTLYWHLHGVLAVASRQPAMHCAESQRASILAYLREYLDQEEEA